MLDWVRTRLRSLLQPLRDEQAQFHAETIRRLEDSIAQAAPLASLLRDVNASVLCSRWLNAPDILGSRREVGHWLNWIGLAGEGVEVGVFQGEFSDHVLRTWEGTRLTSIDPWREFPSEDYVDKCNAPQAEHDRNHAMTVRRLAKFADRSKILRVTSEEGAAAFADGSLDFVYLDAQHHYEAVKKDIGLWRPKLKPDGVIGGHDYLDGLRAAGLYGVKRAVDEYILDTEYSLIVTREPAWPSWFARIG